MRRDFAKLGPFPGISYAEMIVEALMAENIPAHSTQDGLTTAYNISGTNLAGNEAYIWVPPEFEDRAREIIKEFFSDF